MAEKQNPGCGARITRGRPAEEGAVIYIIERLIRSETATGERAKRYILSGVLGLLSGAFFVSATVLLIYGASQVMKYVHH